MTSQCDGKSQPKPFWLAEFERQINIASGAGKTNVPNYCCAGAGNPTIWVPPGLGHLWTKGPCVYWKQAAKSRCTFKVRWCRLQPIRENQAAKLNKKGRLGALWSPRGGKTRWRGRPWKLVREGWGTEWNCKSQQFWPQLRPNKLFSSLPGWPQQWPKWP